MQGSQGPPGPKGDKVSLILVMYFIKQIYLNSVSGLLTKCLSQGEKGIGLAGPPGRTGPQGLKVSKCTPCSLT